MPGSVEGGTATCLGFVNGESTPAFAAKIFRNPDAGEEARAERDILKGIHEHSSEVGRSVPRVILCEKISGRWVLVESILQGAPMMMDMSQDGFPLIEQAIRNMKLAKDWLIEFNRAPAKDKDGTEGRIASLDEKIKLFVARFGPSENEIRFLNRMRDSVSLFARERQETYIQHGDFCRHNILIEDHGKSNRINVIDWSFSRGGLSPFHDLYFFLSTYFLQMRKENGLSGFKNAFRNSFIDTNRYSGLVREIIADYCVKLSIEPAVAPFFFGLFLLEQTLFEYNQLARCRGQGIIPRFNIYLSLIGNRGFGDVDTEILWIHFFKLFIEL
ncbi:MAG TPA: phosphotransferase, partial [Syntrophorhabdaceae bacterium]